MDLFHARTPDIWERLRNNALATDIETPAIRESIDIAQTRLIALLLQNQGGPLVEVEYLSSYIAQYSSLLAPIRRLPIDVLRTIFLDPALHKTRPATAYNYRGIVARYSPNGLGAVCHHWRSVTCEMATLWSNLLVFLDWPHQYTIDSFRIALSRSRNAPLNLTFKSVSPSPWSTLDDEIMEEVFKHAARWVQVELPLDPRFLQQLAPIEGRLESLHTLTFTTNDKYTALPPTKAFDFAPKLRHFQLFGSFSPDISALPVLPWLQLESLHINSNRDNPEFYHQLLSRTQNASQLVVSLRDAREANPQEIMSCELRSLAVYGHCPENRGQESDILKRINAPALESLAMVYFRLWKHSTNENVRSFIKRSGCHLRTLRLESIPIRPVDLLELLRMLPTVENFVLSDLLPNSITKRVLQSLTFDASSGDETLLPMMTTFAVDGGYLFDADALLTMLQSRLMHSHLRPRLVHFDIILPTLNIPTARLEEFIADTAIPMAASFSFICVNEFRRNTVHRRGTPLFRGRLNFGINWAIYLYVVGSSWVVTA
ncbi:hypothetical protein R3P38DRAFT_2857686 [Favolaschia claudopus]|uniref:F-box domain-containing protein n=1 Tax=Favolaschia claudopus TaxID=2862362 RepID=A0AAW0DJ55_9AGAR